MRNGELQKQKTSSVASAQEEFEVTLHVGHQYVVRTTTLAEVKVFDGDAAADHTVEQVLHELLRENRPLELNRVDITRSEQLDDGARRTSVEVILTVVVQLEEAKYYAHQMHTTSGKAVLIPRH